MNCETCNDRLLDLLYEELPEPEADEARAHVSECAACKSSLEELEVTHRLLTALPMEEPSRSVDAAILAAARQKVGAEPAREQRRDGHEEDGGLWGSILRWLTGFAGSPQFVMATIMMLVVAIGLWYVPNARREPAASGGTVVAPDHQGEAAPSATLAPAEPLDLDLDERRGRIRSRGDEGPGAGIAAQQAQEPNDQNAVQREQRARGAARPEPAGVVRDESLSDLERAPAMEMELAEGSAIGGADRSAEPRSAPSQAGSRGAFAGDVDGAEEAQASAQPPPAYRQPSTQRSAPSGGEAAVPAPSREEMMPDAIHRRARGYAQANACQTAISEYQALLRMYPRYSGRAQAMIELADCQQRLGQFAAAESTLRDVERSYPASATDARNRRVRIEMRRRARQAAPAEAASEAY